MVNIKVAVRIRPLSDRELLRGEEIVVRKENKSIVVVNPKIPERQDGDSRQRSRRFSVDFCYDPQDPEGCSQETVYKEIGSEVLDSILEGYNACVLAYGHSASGKTYTIMGAQDDPGLTPRLCEGLFQRAVQKSCHKGIRVEVAASFLEIYNEKVKDLLGSEETGAASSKLPLRVREHPKLGPYVQGLSEHSVTDERALLELLTAGNRKRSTAATENNRQSSRSHAVFTIHFRQSDGDKCETEKWSKVDLVDLAGSLQEVPQQETSADERASSAQSKTRLQEGANINKSLVTLGYVISALAESLETSAVPKEHPASKSWQPFVPYRDSVLTWLLKDTLGGNSNTIMIATISPASGCLSETVNTLRYAKRTKRIVNEAVVNEDPKVRTIRELRREIERLKGLLVSFQSVPEEGSDRREIWERWITEGVMKSEAKKGGQRGAEGEGLGRWGSRGNVGGHSAASPKSLEVNDEKQSVVNGSSNDTFSHESEIFSDSLESLGSGFVKRGISCGAENEGSAGTKRTEAGCCEKLRIMHRSRPDLIKGISGHLKERPPSSSSQSCADVSNLSQSTSENSVTSSGSVEVQPAEGRGGGEKEVALGVKDWRSEVVDVVTTRLYLTKKKSEQWVKVVDKKENADEVEESKLCKRARMKLFDLRRKLGMTRRLKRTVDSDTQTDSSTGTIRVKEKCVETDLDMSLDDKAEGSLGNEGFRGRDRSHLETTNFSVESGTQTAREEKSDKSANTSPTEFSPRDEESFSDDSLELEHETGCAGTEERESCNAGSRCRSGMANYLSGLRGENEKQKVKVGEAGESVFEELPLRQRSFHYAAAHSSNTRLASRRDENLPSDSSFTSAEGTEIVSSSDVSSEDFVFYENPKEDLGVETTATRDRELYTITENSEQSDPGDTFSPIQSQTYFVEDGTGRKWSQSSGVADLEASGKKGCRKEAESEKEWESVWKGEGNVGKAKKMKWSDWQSNSERQYLNLNVSSSGRSPFSIDTHLFGKKWRKEHSPDGIFTSADSVTLVLMGPAKPKSSVLMEIIRRSMERNSLSGEAQFTHRKWKSRGVQCDESLVRSVSVDMATIALSRIARNQDRLPNIARATSLDGMDAIPAEEKDNGSQETTCRCYLDPNCSGINKKKSALKCSRGTEALSPYHTDNDLGWQSTRQRTERQKKSVSWSGETTYDGQLGSSPSGDKSNLCDVPLHQTQAGIPPTPTDPPRRDSKTHCFKPESSQVTVTTGALNPTDEFTVFLKEAIHLLKQINSRSKDVEIHVHTDAQERMSDKCEFSSPDKTDKWSGKENGTRASDGESGMNSTWPRRRGMTGKPPTGMKSRFGRSGNGGRSESLLCSGLVNWTRNCQKASGALPARNCYSEETEKRARSYRLPDGDEDNRDKDAIVAGMGSPRTKTGKMKLKSVFGAERLLEKNYRGLGLAAERDELREELEESRKDVQFDGECYGLEAKVYEERWEAEDEWKSWKKEVRKGMKRRKDGVCLGGCSCTASARDPCKHLLRKGCQSSFELDSFGPGSKHCHQMCMFCRKKDLELYSSTLNLNSECLSDACRLDYYGYCPCSSVRLTHVAWSPRAYMQHLLTMRRQIVGRTKARQLDLRSIRAQPFSCLSSSYSFPSSARK